jgi:hypothetical protein
MATCPTSDPDAWQDPEAIGLPTSNYLLLRNYVGSLRSDPRHPSLLRFGDANENAELRWDHSRAGQLCAAICN